MNGPASPDDTRLRRVGCCGAYCAPCRALRDGACKGCKLGYGPGGRDLRRARCAIKVCCFGERRLETCADCSDYVACATIGEFLAKNGYKYQKYAESLEYIRKNGYEKFLEAAARWNGPYGRF
ncbi:MAG: DUF3795 domain-containing protein [Methanospirillum sp.]